MVAFPLWYSPSFRPLKLVLSWPLINANINDHLLKSHKMPCKAYLYDFFSEKQCRYAFQVAKEVPVCHTDPYCSTSSPASDSYV